MAIIDRPTLTELRARVRARIQAAAPGVTFFRQGLMTAIVDAIAGALHLSLVFTEQAGRLAHPATTEGSELERLAAVWGVERRAAAAATVRLTVSLYTGGGETLEAGYSFVVAGRSFALTAETQLTDGVSDYELTATAETDGVIETINAGAAAVSDLQATVVVAGFTNGAADETDEALRGRLHERISAPISGGTEIDWVRWAKEIAGVTRAWATGGGGIVRVGFVYDDRAVITPTAEELTAMRQHLTQYRPAGVELIVFAPVVQELSVRISTLELPEGYDTAVARALITASIIDTFNNNAFLGDGTRAAPVSWIYEGAAAGVPGVGLVVSAPATGVVVDEGKILKVREVIYG